MTFSDSVKTCFSKYATFSGRASRSEYWWFWVFNVLVSACLALVLPALSTVYSLVVLLPNLAVSVRRLHDVGKSGWMYLICLIPLVGAIWLLVLACTDSEPGANQYGENPKGL